MSDCRYTRACTIDEAVEALVEAKGEAHIIAGGIALGILMNERLVDPSWLIDLSRIEELKGIELLPDGTLRIGAMVRHRDIENSELVAQACPLLTEMVAEVACGRVRNRGTIGGNICLGDPQGDSPVALIALGATLRAAGPNGMRDIPVRDFFEDWYTTALNQDELLQEIRVPPPPTGSATAFGKFAARRAMDYSSTISIAVRLVRDPGDGRISEIGLGCGGVGPIPVWPKRTEAVLINKQPTPETFEAMRRALFDELDPVGDHLYSADYKRHVGSVILRRTLQRAYDRADRAGGA